MYFVFLNYYLFFFIAELTTKDKRTSESTEDYVDITMDALILINKNIKTAPSDKKAYRKIEPAELEHISMEEIIRVSHLL